MAFTPAQQGKYRPMVEWAWQQHCNRDAQAVSTRCKKHPRCHRCGFCRWYEAELAAATMLSTTSYCDRRRDFEKAMAHFEAAAGGGPGRDPFYWNHRIYGADARRIMHNIRELTEQFDCDERYLQGIARKALRTEVLPPLGSLTYDLLLVVLRAIKIEIARQLRHTDRPSVPAPRDENPF